MFFQPPPKETWMTQPVLGEWDVQGMSAGLAELGLFFGQKGGVLLVLVVASEPGIFLLPSRWK